MTDPYKALGVTPKSSDTEIKKAYRRLAKEYHPDRTGGDKAKEERFKNISAAYGILSDPAKRSQFDNAARGGGIPMGADLSEIFAQMFGGAAAGGRGPRVQRGYGGGMGGSPFGNMGGGSPFGNMGGGGSPFGNMGFPGHPQPVRKAKAQPKKSPPKSRKLKAADGSPLLARSGNIYSDLRIPYDMAMVGSVAKVPTLTGSAKVTIPPGTCSGQKLRLKGKGAQKSTPKGTPKSTRSGSKTGTKTATKAPAKASHGDHIVTVQIDVPKVGSGEGSELLAKLVKYLDKSKG